MRRSLLAVMFAAAGCVEDVVTRHGPPDEPTPLGGGPTKPLRASAPKPAADQAPPPRAVEAAPATPPAPASPTLTRALVRQAYEGPRSSGWCGTGDRWRDLLFSPHTPADLELLRAWARDPGAEDRHIAVEALDGLADGDLETWRQLARDEGLASSDLRRAVRRLLVVGGNPEVPLALAALRRPPAAVPLPWGPMQAEEVLRRLDSATQCLEVLPETGPTRPDSPVHLAAP